MSRLIKDLEDGANEGWYGEFFEVEVYLAEQDDWEEHGEAGRFDWRKKAERYAQYHADLEGRKMRVVMVRTISQPIAGAVFEPSAVEGT